MPIGAEVERPCATGTAWLRRLMKEFGRTLFDAVLLQQPPVMAHQELEMVVEQPVQTLVNVVGDNGAQLLRDRARISRSLWTTLLGSSTGTLKPFTLSATRSPGARVGHDRHDACRHASETVKT